MIRQRQNAWFAFIEYRYTDDSLSALCYHLQQKEPSYSPERGRAYRWLHATLGYAPAERLAPYWYELTGAKRDV